MRTVYKYDIFGNGGKGEREDSEFCESQADRSHPREVRTDAEEKKTKWLAACIFHKTP